MNTLFALVVLINGHVLTQRYATKDDCEIQGGAMVEITQVAEDYVCLPVTAPQAMPVEARK